MSPGQPAQFLEFITLFNEGKFFESHEVLEDLWKKTSEPQKTFYQGLIQAAVALHHHEKKNFTGSDYEHRKSIEKLLQYPSEFQNIHIPHFLRQLEAYLSGDSPEKPVILLV